MSPRRRYETPLVLALLAAGIGLERVGVISARQFDAAFVAALAFSLWRAGPQLGMPSRVTAAIAVAGVPIAIGVQALVPSLSYAPYLGVVLLHIAVGAVFVLGILPGRTPILLQFVRHMGRGNEGTPAFQRFMRRQCWVWAGLSAATAIAATVAIFSPPARAGAGIATAALVACQIAWFVLSHYYAQWRYERPESWHHTLATLSRPSAWSRLEI